MSTEQGEGSSSQTAASASQYPTERTAPSVDLSTSEQSSQTPTTPHRHGDEATVGESPESRTDEKKPAASQRDQPSESTSPTTPDDPSARPRPVIAVSASKGPAAFFNLARKFLVTDEMCDLSALEGAIVSAVDAAHLLERSKLASIVRVQTSYVTVEPKRRKQAPSPQQHQRQHPQSQHGTGVAVSPIAAGIPSSHTGVPEPPAVSHSAPASRGRPSGHAGRELRRARIVITVRRTDCYKRWLEENPLQAIIAGDGGEDEEVTAGASETQPPPR